jgi:hypothetical protein
MISASSAAAGRWSFPLALLDLGRYRLDPRGTSALAVFGRVNPPSSTSVLHLPFKAPVSGWVLANGPSSLGIRPRIAPPPLDLPRVHSRAPHRSETPDGPTAPSVSARVPSSWFLTTSTVCPARGLQVYCTLLAVVGSAAFHLAATRSRSDVSPHPTRLGRRREDSRDATRTLRRVPLPSSRTVSPRPLPSCRWRVQQGGGASRDIRCRMPSASTAPSGRSTPRRCSTGESVLTHRRCRRLATRSFHGLGSPPRCPTHAAAAVRSRRSDHTEAAEATDQVRSGCAQARQHCGLEPVPHHGES